MKRFIEYIGPKKVKIWRNISFIPSEKFGGKIVAEGDDDTAMELLKYEDVFKEIEVDELMEAEAITRIEAEKKAEPGIFLQDNKTGDYADDGNKKKNKTGYAKK